MDAQQGLTSSLELVSDWFINQDVPCDERKLDLTNLAKTLKQTKKGRGFTFLFVHFVQCEKHTQIQRMSHRKIAKRRGGWI